jgi:hypothetical protein
VPQSRFKFWWDWLTICCVFYNAFDIPWNIAFKGGVDAVAFDTAVDICISLLLVCDIFLTFRSSYFDINGRLISDPAHISAKCE